jgi:hypothetical protein
MPIHKKALALCKSFGRGPGLNKVLERKKSTAAPNQVESTDAGYRNARLALFAALLLAGAPLAAIAGDPDAVAPTAPPKQKSYLHHIFAGPGPYLKAAAGAGIAQAKGTPYEWGGGVQGYAKRFGSAFGKHLVKGSIQYGVARLRHEELGYRPSGKQGAGPRLRYALLRTVITRKTTTGASTFSAGEISGVVGSGLISRLWQPASLHTVASGFGSAGISLGADAGYNVVREFWPEIRHPRRRKAKDADDR